MKDALRIFHRAALSRRDFHEAHEFLARLGREKNKTVRYALLTAAIIAYARPFSRNENGNNAEAGKRLHITPSSILDPSQLAIHTTVLRLRNKMIAHAEYSECPVRLLDADKHGMTLLGPYVDKDGFRWDLRDYLEQIDTTIFLRIADIFACHCLDEMFTLKKKYGLEQSVPPYVAQGAPSGER